MIIRSLLAFLAAATCARADLVWEKPVQEFHRVPDDGHLATKFAFKNTGPGTIKIKRVTSSCGCTSAKLAKNSFAPGESGEIEVKFTFGFRRGPQRKGISVTSDDKREWVLDLRVFIHEPLTLAPALVYWRVGDAADAKMVKLTTPADGTKVGVKSVTSSDPRVTATVQTVKAGGEYLVQIKPASTSAKLAAELTVTTDFPADAPRSYRIFARIK
ncbi:MAG: DUF1573 domain-containing protein [Chthoniobacteraceae bacterium]